MYKFITVLILISISAHLFIHTSVFAQSDSNVQKQNADEIKQMKIELDKLIGNEPNHQKEKAGLDQSLFKAIKEYHDFNNKLMTEIDSLNLVILYLKDSLAMRNTELMKLRTLKKQIENLSNNPAIESEDENTALKSQDTKSPPKVIVKKDIQVINQNADFPTPGTGYYIVLAA